MRKIKDIRLFFALWPDESVREAISCYTRLLPPDIGRVVPRYNWHMTLHFIGNTTFVEKDCLHSQAAKLEAKPFDLQIDCDGYFRKPKVAWLGCRQPPDALFDLQRNLGRLISQCEYQPETRPYSPHVTVVRKVSKKPTVMSRGRVDWHVNRFVLIESVSEQDGVRYRVLEEYPLT